MPAASQKRGALFVLVLILAPLFFLRAIKDAGPGPYGLDASQYVQVARHVAAGDGLVTTMSLYHHGYVLPARVDVQPLWMLVLGYTGRAIGIVEAATLLPRVFYVAALLLLYALTRIVASRFENRTAYLAYAPHAVVALLGTNFMFFSSTTHPYREGISYTLGFAALLATEWIARRRSIPAAVVAGALTALAWLGRMEFAAVGVGCVLAMVICRIPFRLIATYVLTGAVVVAPWILYHGHIPGLGRLGVWFLRPGVTIPGPPLAPVLTTSEKIADWVEGALIAFRLGHPFSFTRTWGVAALLVPVAVIVALLAWARRRERPLPRDLTVLATAFTAIVIFIEVFFYRGGVFMHFMFGWRHGISLVFLLAVAIPLLFAHRNAIVRAVAAAAVVVSVATGAFATVRVVREPNFSYSGAERALLRWLPPKTMVLTTRTEMLGMLSDAYFHNTYCDARPEATRAFLENVGVDYVILYEPERGCRFVDGLGDVLRVHAAFGDGPRRIYLLAPK